MTTAPLTEAREVERDHRRRGQPRITVDHHPPGKPVAVVLSHDGYEALIETLNVLSDEDAIAAVAEAEADVTAGRLKKA